MPPNTSITNASGTEGTDPNIARQNARYDSSDMGKSFRNAYRDAGYAYDPWNKDIKNTVSRFGAAALPQYLSSLAGGANYGDSAGGSLQNFLTQYIQGILGGGGGIMPWSMGQAQQGMGQLAGLAETARNQYTQSGGDYSKVNLGNPLLNALANLFMDEDTVSSMNASAYAPSMDSSLLSSLIDHIGNAQQYYGDVTRPGQIGKKPGELAPTWATILQQQLGGR